MILLPSVARDNGYGARAMLDALVRKANLSAPLKGLFTFEVDRVVARSKAGRKVRGGSPRDAAAAWLARLVRADGSIVFAIDARSGSSVASGEMHHARTAAAVQALALHGSHPALVTRARKRLARDARKALAGGAVEAWPANPARVAGTLAHLERAGVDVKRALLARAPAPRYFVRRGTRRRWRRRWAPRLPSPSFEHASQGLDARPWAPWTVLALAGRELAGLSDARSRAVEALIASLRTQGPHCGGVNVTPIPEVALTALTVEALRSVRPTQAVRAAIARGISFLSVWQIAADRVPAAFAPEASIGAFVGSPISSGLRADVTAHALMAI